MSEHLSHEEKVFAAVLSDAGEFDASVDMMFPDEPEEHKAIIRKVLSKHWLGIKEEVRNGVDKES